MIVFGCEESQAVTKEFRKLGYEAYSCDLLPCSGGYPEWHYQEDIMNLLPRIFISLSFLGFHPVCQYLANSGVRWLASTKPKKDYEWSEKYQIYINQDRFDKMEKAAWFFKSALSYVESVGFGYVENPIMHKYAMEIIQRKPTQTIQPYQFGHMEQKATCLWIVGLPELQPTNNVYDEMMNLKYKDRCKIHYASPGKDRAKLRSKTYHGIAKAMAIQWSEYLSK